MKLEELAHNWESFGTEDPLWAIVTDERFKGGKWNLQEFLQTGAIEVQDEFEYLDRLGIHPKGKAPDFGCGVGRLTQALAPRFDQTVGVDIAQSMIDMANRINQHGDKVQYVVN